MIGQCYALMWAPCAACPPRCPSFGSAATGWTFSSSWRRDLNTQVAAATSDSWHTLSPYRGATAQRLPTQATSTHLCAQYLPIHHTFASLTRSAQRECVDSPLFFYNLAGVGDNNPGHSTCDLSIPHLPEQKH